MVDRHGPDHPAAAGAHRRSEGGDQRDLLLFPDAERGDGGPAGAAPAALHQLDGHPGGPPVQPLHEHRAEGGGAEHFQGPEIPPDHWGRVLRLQRPGVEIPVGAGQRAGDLPKDLEMAGCQGVPQLPRHRRDEGQPGRSGRHLPVRREARLLERGAVPDDRRGDGPPAGAAALPAPPTRSAAFCPRRRRSWGWRRARRFSPAAPM